MQHDIDTSSDTPQPHIFGLLVDGRRIVEAPSAQQLDEPVYRGGARFVAHDSWHTTNDPSLTVVVVQMPCLAYEGLVW